MAITSFNYFIRIEDCPQEVKVAHAKKIPIKVPQVEKRLILKFEISLLINRDSVVKELKQRIYVNFPLSYAKFLLALLVLLICDLCHPHSRRSISIEISDIAASPIYL